MEYIALLRGINVGGNHKVEMKKLRTFFESLGCINVSTYINSGNVFFELTESRQKVLKRIETGLKKEFDFNIPILLKTKNEIEKIADDIPKAWQNDLGEKSDVAYLFSEIDSEEILNVLPIKKEFIDIRYINGAVIWNVKRKNINKSHLAKIIAHESYKFMTVRNVNTARYLAVIK